MPAARKALRHPAPRTVAKTKAKKPAPARPRTAAGRRAGPRIDTGKPDRPYEHAGVTLHRIDHLTIRAHQKDMEPLKDFYEAVLGLKPGKRPDFAFPGYWLYMGERAVIHLAGNAHPDAPASESGATLGFDHVSFRTTGLQAMRERLRRLNIKFDEIPVPGFPLHQIFFRDPVGMKVELTFDAAELEAAPADRAPPTGSVHYRT
jgi:catechol 2,3-dioxygenase-like lactoylglutathione lyase family enzyme